MDRDTLATLIGVFLVSAFVVGWTLIAVPTFIENPVFNSLSPPIQLVIVTSTYMIAAGAVGILIAFLTKEASWGLRGGFGSFLLFFVLDSISPPLAWDRFGHVAINQQSLPGGSTDYVIGWLIKQSWPASTQIYIFGVTVQFFITYALIPMFLLILALISLGAKEFVEEFVRP